MKRILSIDGGGIRGIIPAIVCADWEKRTGKRIAEEFDLIGGTSTGGILALALAAGIPASQLVDFYRVDGKRIFKPGIGRGWFMARYSSKPLKDALEHRLRGRLMLSAETRVFVTAYDCGRRSCVTLRSWDADDVPMVTAAMATSAAPTYFKPHDSWIDGGVVLNNPAMEAYSLACELWPGEDAKVVSLGTGEHEQAIKPPRGGIVQWARALPKIVMDTDDSPDCQLRRILLGWRYIRIQPDLRDVPADMDDASRKHMAQLEQVAERAVERARAIFG